MVRLFAPALVLFAALAPPLAHAQVNIDQDKTPAHIWASDCAVCHKSMRGLANGRGRSALTEFLSEHYTSNEQEAAALAAYVLAGGGGSGKPAPVRAEQPDHGQAAGEVPKEQGRKPAKPEQGASAKPPRHSTARGKPAGEERSAAVETGPSRGEQKPPPDRRKPSPAARPHERPTPTVAAPPKPEHTQVAAAPKPAEPPKPEVSPPAAAPSGATPPETPPSEATLPPRDNIPD